VLECPGVKYPGIRAVEEIFTEVRRQADAFQDYVVPAKQIRMAIDPEKGIQLTFNVSKTKQLSLPMTRHVYVQLCNWVGLPVNSKLFKYLRYGRGDYQYSRHGAKRVTDRFWQTWCDLFNAFFEQLKGKKLIRTLKDHDDCWYVRAFLSDQYLVIPNDQLFLAVAEQLKSQKAEPWDARLSENSFYLYAVAPGISAQVRKDRPFADGARWMGDKVDTVNAAVLIRNSETGQGGCEVCPAIVTKVTGSYFVRQNALSRRHVGSRHEMDGLLSAKTIKKRNSLFFEEVRDYVNGIFDEEKFQEFVDRINDATQDEVSDPLMAAKAVRATYELSEAREGSIVKWLTKSGDRSRYGLARALAGEAHDNQLMEPSEAVRLERASVDLIENQTMVRMAGTVKTIAEREAAKAVRKAERAKNSVVAARSDLDL
jgi:hypothetical protein